MPSAHQKNLMETTLENKPVTKTTKAQVRKTRSSKKKACPIQSTGKIFQRIFATFAAGILPIAAYWIAHYEAPENPAMWILVACALLYSAPTLALWAENLWITDTKVWKVTIPAWMKSWGFAILLEGVMTFSKTEALALSALAILAGVNAAIAAAGKSPTKPKK